jgi:hypothetical protein
MVVQLSPQRGPPAPQDPARKRSYACLLVVGIGSHCSVRPAEMRQSVASQRSVVVRFHSSSRRESVRQLPAKSCLSEDAMCDESCANWIIAAAVKK